MIKQFIFVTCEDFVREIGRKWLSFPFKSWLTIEIIGKMWFFAIFKTIFIKNTFFHIYLRFLNKAYSKYKKWNILPQPGCQIMAIRKILWLIQSFPLYKNIWVFAQLILVRKLFSLCLLRATCVTYVLVANKNHFL